MYRRDFITLATKLVASGPLWLQWLLNPLLGRICSNCLAPADHDVGLNIALCDGCVSSAMRQQHPSTGCACA